MEKWILKNKITGETHGPVTQKEMVAFFQTNDVQEWVIEMPENVEAKPEVDSMVFNEDTLLKAWKVKAEAEEKIKQIKESIADLVKIEQDKIDDANLIIEKFQEKAEKKFEESPNIDAVALGDHVMLTKKVSVTFPSNHDAALGIIKGTIPNASDYIKVTEKVNVVKLKADHIDLYNSLANKTTKIEIKEISKA